MKYLLTLMMVVTMSCRQQPLQLDIQGHRGARAIYPENTLPGFLYALELGIQTLELDLGVTQDEVVVIYHDQTINPQFCQYVDGTQVAEGIAIHSLTFEQIKKFDCGSKGNERFPLQKIIPQTKIPSLDEFFEFILSQKNPHAQKVWFNIETKSHPDFPHYQPSPERFVALIHQIIDKHQVADRTIIQSFDHRTLKVSKELRPEIKTAALFYERPEGPLVEATKKAHGDILSPYYQWLTHEDVQNLRREKIPVIPWTANTQESWQKLIELGVDGIITDDPEGLLRFLDKR